RKERRGVHHARDVHDHARGARGDLPCRSRQAHRPLRGGTMSDVSALTSATPQQLGCNCERNIGATAIATLAQPTSKLGATSLQPQKQVKVAGENAKKHNENRPSTHRPGAPMVVETPPSQRHKRGMVGSPPNGSRMVGGRPKAKTKEKERTEG